MNKKIIMALIIITASFSSLAQTGQEQEMKRQIHELMKAREEMIRSLFDDSNDSSFQNFNKHFEDLARRFERESFGPDMDMGDIVGEYDWRETETHQILVLKVKQIKDKPLDIKVEKGQIKLKGDVESVDSTNTKSAKSERITRVHFERVFSIPNGVDQTNPEFENKSGELLIKFKKLKISKSLINKTPSLPPSKNNTGEPIDQRRPVGKDADDVTI